MSYADICPARSIVTVDSAYHNDFVILANDEPRQEVQPGYSPHWQAGPLQTASRLSACHILFRSVRT